MKKTDAAYFAGLFDGEGSISILLHPSKSCRTGTRYSLTIAVTSADEWVAQSLRMVFGGYITIGKSTLSGRPVWHWNLPAKRAMECLQILLPYLKLKQQQAEIAIHFQRNKSGRNNRPACHARVTDEELAIEEAQRILLSSMHRKGRKIKPIESRPAQP